MLLKAFKRNDSWFVLAATQAIAALKASIKQLQLRAGTLL
jgi:hypothetical protein